MDQTSFTPPSVERMNELMPAYEFVTIVGLGKHHAVYIATQKSLDRHVAIKVHCPQVSSLPEFREAFESTARAMAKLNHVNLIGVFNSGEIEGMLYLVMEFVAGSSIAHATQGAALDLAQTVALMDYVCDGLSHAHASGIHHGGLGLSRVLLNQKLEPKIGGFGDFETDMGEVGAEFRCRAPELHVAGAMPTAQSDVYALGAMFYELLTGRQFAPDAPAPSTITECIPEVDAVWARATSADLATRFASVKDFQAAMRQAMKRMTAAAKKASQPKTLNPAQAAVRTQLKASKGHGKLPSSNSSSKGKLLLNALIIAGLLGAIFYVLNEQKASKVAKEKEQARLTAERLRNQQQAELEAQQKAQMERQLKEQQAQQAQQEQQENTNQPHESAEKPHQKPKRPRVTLEELRDSLRSGNRARMPSGTQAIDGDYFYRVDNAMTWHEAAAFAEEYGAHLAVPSAQATLEWMHSKLKGAATGGAWIGGGRGGREPWRLVTGKALTLSAQPSGNGAYLMLGADGALVAEDGFAKHPFLIQWHADARNPGKFENLLALAGSTSQSGAPVLPPGTIAFGVRSYLYVPTSVSWQDAEKLAVKAGGHLAWAGGIAERLNLEKLVKSLPAEAGIWMGGQSTKGTWKTVTGEPWKDPKWANGAAPKSESAGLVIYPTGDYAAAPADQPLPGLLIEWSEDAKSAAQ